MLLTYVIIALVLAIFMLVATKGVWLNEPIELHDEDDEEGNKEKNLNIGADKPRICRDAFSLFFLASVVAGTLISLVIWALLYIFALPCIPTESTYTLEEKTPVYALQDNYYINLKESANTLVYLTKEEHGFQTNVFDTNSKEVYFEYIGESEEPCLEIRSKKFLKGWWNIFVKPRATHISVDRIYVFKIPEESVAYEYSIDLQ